MASMVQISRRPTDDQTSHAFVMSRSKCPGFSGSMSQPPPRAGAKPNSTRAHAWTAACGPRGHLFPWSKVVECLIDTGPARPPSASIDRSGAALCEGPTATRCMFRGALAGWVTFMLVCRMCGWVGVLYFFWTLLRHDCPCRSRVWAGLKCAFGFWPDCSLFAMIPTLIKLAYQPVLSCRLIRINIKIRLIANNYNYLPQTLFHLLNILTLKYTFIII